jgi:hypothetical protein
MHKLTHLGALVIIMFTLSLYDILCMPYFSECLRVPHTQTVCVIVLAVSMC